MNVGDAERGRQLLMETGVYEYDRQNDQLDVIAYLRSERDRIGWAGQCSGGCDWVGLVVHHFTGQAVCPRTYEPCERRRLGGLLELYAKVNA